MFPPTVPFLYCLESLIMESVLYYEVIDTLLNAFILLLVSIGMIKASLTSPIMTWLDYAVAIFFFVVFCVMVWLIGDIAFTHILHH